mgnify:CR=1 FL=1
MNRTILASIRALALMTSLASLTLTPAGAQGKTSGRIHGAIRTSRAPGRARRS